MKIIEITKDFIYCFVDETFVIFDRLNLVTNGDNLGSVWAAGKSTEPNTVAPSKMGRGCCYHNMLMEKLIKMAVGQDSPE